MNLNKGRARLLSSACIAALALTATHATAQAVNVADANAGISVNQTNNAFGNATDLDITSIIDPTVEIDIDGIVENDTFLIGGAGAGRNILSAIMAGNEASSQITSAVTNDLIGVSLAQTAAAPTVDSSGEERTRAASDSFANLAISVSQTANQMNGIVGVVNIADPDDLLTGSSAAQMSIDGNGIQSSSAAILNNTIEGVGTLNRSGSGIEVSGTNSTNASSGISSSQAATASNLTVAINAEVLIGVDDAVDSSELTVAGNAQRAVGVGNLASNSIDTSVNDLTALNGIFPDLNSSSGALVPANDFDDTTSGISVDMATGRLIPGSSATAGAAISNSQVITSIDDIVNTGELIPSILRASVDGSDAGFKIEVDEGVTNSSLSTDSNTVLANIRGNAADNQISLDANDISVLGVDVGTPLGATSSITDNGSTATLTLNFDITDSDILAALSGEIGGTVSGSTIIFDFDDSDPVGQAESLQSDLASGPQYFMQAGNSYAFALASENVNIGAITPFTTTVQESGTIAAVANSQMFDATAIATAMGEAGSAVSTDLGANVETSQISTSRNAIEAQAIGNTASNGVTVSANNLNTSGTPDVNASAVVTLPGTLTTDLSAVSTAGITVSSTQLATGSVRATLNTDPAQDDGGTGSYVETLVGGSVLDSSVRSDGNRLSASAVGNEVTTGTNLVSVKGTNVATSTAVSNLQVMDADVSASALLGRSEIISVRDESLDTFDPTTISDVVFEFSGDSHGAGEYSTTIADWTELDSDQRDDILDDIKSSLGELLSGNLNVDSSTGKLSFEVTGASSANPWVDQLPPYSATYTSLVEGFRPELTLIARGVTTEVDGVIERSLLSVDDNEVAGSVTGNFASNRIEAAATNLLAGGDLTLSSANSEFDPDISLDLTSIASADNALTNVQQVGSNPDNTPNLSTNVGAAFAIITEDPSTRRVTDSSLSVSGNEQFATTRANVANNTIDLTATNMGADDSVDDEGDIGTGAALLSLQLSNATVTANSDMEVYAPAAILNSSLDISDNRNQAVATMNTATNTVSVSGSNIESISGGVNAQLALDTAINVTDPAASVISQTAQGDFVLNNIQSATTSVAATANTQIFNVDQGDDTGKALTNGITNSTITLERNVTVAEGTANLATNKMEITGGALFAGTGGVFNSQASTAGVSATATTNVAIDTEANADIIAANSSSVEISGNGTSSRALGNSASNILNASAVSFASAGHSAANASSDVGAGLGGSVNASFAVLNAQTNTGDVDALTTARYGATMRSDGDSANILNSSFGAMGNTVQATAMGNMATNAVTVSALNQANSSAAIGSQQMNTGNISASISNSYVGVSSLGSGSVNGSQISIGGNSMVSSATGNFASNSITRN